ncbi:MAG: GSCFA domain-containing protein [Flavobacterium sp.]|nr:GSCFA domain-containing protein [Flavobacterium sp.]
MNFSTPIPLRQSKFLIDYNSKIISLGSCFAENIGEKLNYFKFRNITNPFGIIFNPISIEKLVERAVVKNYFTEKDLFYHNERWHCFEIHSDLSNASQTEFLEKLNQLLEEFILQIQTSNFFIITYGTSWIYRNLNNNKVVANCHKMPQNQFTKELLSVENILKSIQNTIFLIQSVNSNAQFIFTISPVRHIKDGFFENNVSKAHLFSAIFKLLKNENVAYFPSYEILMDELRDYRFYKKDMLHPSETAIAYIWDKFKNSFINPSVFPAINDIEVIQKGLQHKAFNPNSESHQQFLSQLQNKINLLQQHFPNIQF